MSETEPLLDPIASYSTNNDPEAPNTKSDASYEDASRLTRWRTQTARILESATLHKTVIALVSHTTQSVELLVDKLIMAV
jgi:hypothetical protein